MAKSITSDFTITASMTTGALGYQTEAIPIGSLIDVADAQALEVLEVDYIWQNYDSTNDVYEPVHMNGPFSADAAFGCQLMDRNAGTWLIASDNNLISSAAVWFEATGQYGTGSDFFPDDFDKSSGRFVVNDELYAVLNVPIGTFSGTNKLACTVRIRARVVKLSTRDWMAISLETVQNE